jgi:hypothetical protein
VAAVDRQLVYRGFVMESDIIRLCFVKVNRPLEQTESGQGTQTFLWRQTETTRARTPKPTNLPGLETSNIVWGGGLVERTHITGHPASEKIGLCGTHFPFTELAHADFVSDEVRPEPGAEKAKNRSNQIRVKQNRKRKQVLSYSVAK